jgi:hypothetical protein
LWNSLFSPQQYGELEVDPKTENGWNPDRSEDRLFPIVCDEPKVAGDEERDHHGQENEEIRLSEH